MSDAIKYLQEHMDDEDVEVEISNLRSGIFFKRKKSGHMVGLGAWETSQNGLSLQRETGMKLKLRWLPQHNGQDLQDQIRHCNLYYVVDGLQRNDQVFSSSILHYLSPNSPINIEYTRLVNVAKAMEEITIGEAAKMRLTRLLAAAMK